MPAVAIESKPFVDLTRPPEEREAKVTEEVAVKVPTVKFPIVDEAEEKSVVVPVFEKYVFGKITEFGRESVQVLLVDKS